MRTAWVASCSCAPACGAEIARGYGPIEALGAAQGEPCGCGGYTDAEMERISSAIRNA